MPAPSVHDSRSPVVRFTMALSAAAALALTSCGSVDDADADEPNGTSGNGGREQTELSWEAPNDLEGSLTLYAANPQGLNEELAERFTELTGVDVEIFGDTTGSITARLDAEWSNPQADVVYIASWGPAAAYAEEGRLMDYEPEFAPTIHEDFSGDSFYGRDGSALALVVNTNAASSTPTDWADLAGDEFQDQVIMPDPRESGTARDLIAAMVSTWGEDETWELFDDLFENGLDVQGPNGPALDSVVAGSHAVVFGGVDYSSYSQIEAGEAIEVTFPESGTVVSPRPFFILEDTDNPEAAQALVDFFLSQEGQEISASHHMIPAQPDVPAAEGNANLDDVELLDYSLEEIEETGDDVLDAFVSRYLD